MAFDSIGLLIFALITLLTPGPNNYLLFAHGKNYGFNDSYKLMAGIFSGFVVLLFISGYGISEIIMRSPTVGLILKIISSAWLIYLAFMLSKLNTMSSSDSHSKIGYIHGLLMQFVNPKAWIVSISGASAFMPQGDNIHLNVFVFAFTYAGIGIPCMATWVSFGGLISKWLKSEKTNRIIAYSIFTLI
jgi:threonine/homoserine/homoserine lactone efflux protein